MSAVAFWNGLRAHTRALMITVAYGAVSEAAAYSLRSKTYGLVTELLQVPKIRSPENQLDVRVA